MNLRDASGSPLPGPDLGWRKELLPYLEQVPLSDNIEAAALRFEHESPESIQIKLAKQFDEAPEVFRCPSFAHVWKHRSQAKKPKHPASLSQYFRVLPATIEDGRQPALLELSHSASHWLAKGDCQIEAFAKELALPGEHSQSHPYGSYMVTPNGAVQFVAQGADAEVIQEVFAPEPTRKTQLPAE